MTAEEFPLEDSKRLCVHLLEEAMAQLPPDSDTLLGIFDLRGFGNRNADLGFVRFLVRFSLLRSPSAAHSVPRCPSVAPSNPSAVGLTAVGILCERDNQGPLITPSRRIRLIP